MGWGTSVNGQNDLGAGNFAGNLRGEFSMSRSLLIRIVVELRLL